MRLYLKFSASSKSSIPFILLRIASKLISVTRKISIAISDISTCSMLRHTIKSKYRFANNLLNNLLQQAVTVSKKKIDWPFTAGNNKHKTQNSLH